MNENKKFLKAFSTEGNTRPQMIHQLAFDAFTGMIAFGSGYSDNFPEGNKMSLKDLINQIKIFQEPFSRSTYRNYDGYEDFDRLFKEYKLEQDEVDQFFRFLKEEVEEQVSKEYLSTYESYLED